MPCLGRTVLPILFLLAFVLSLPDHGLPPVPPAAYAQGLIRNLIARLRGEKMPAGILKANGQTEASQADVSSKYPGRLAEISVTEGTKVAIGQAIARVSSPKGDVTLVSPRNGEVEDLLAEAGDEVVAGESIVTIIDLTDVYLTVFLPAADAATLGIGDDARVVLDAAPDYVIPAVVGFIASDTRISPKAVETKEERAKQTFRVRSEDRSPASEDISREGRGRAAGRRLCSHEARREMAGRTPNKTTPGAGPAGAIACPGSTRARAKTRARRAFDSCPRAGARLDARAGCRGALFLASRARDDACYHACAGLRNAQTGGRSNAAGGRAKVDVGSRGCR